MSSHPRRRDEDIDEFSVNFDEFTGESEEVPLTRKEEAQMKGSAEGLEHPSDILELGDESSDLEEEELGEKGSMSPDSSPKSAAAEQPTYSEAEEPNEEEMAETRQKSEASVLPIQEEEEEEEEYAPPPPRQATPQPPSTRKLAASKLAPPPPPFTASVVSASRKSKSAKKKKTKKTSVPKPVKTRYSARLYGSKSPSRDLEVYTYITDIEIEVCAKFVKKGPKMLKQCLENNFDDEIWVELDDIERREASKYPYLAVEVPEEGVAALPIKNPHVDILEVDESFFTTPTELQSMVARLRAMVKMLQAENEELERKLREYKNLLDKKDRELADLRKRCGMTSLAQPVTELVKEVVKSQKEVAVAKYQSEAEKEKARSIKEVAKPPAVSLGDISQLIQTGMQALSMFRGKAMGGPAPAPPRAGGGPQMPPPPAAPPGGIYMPPPYGYPPGYYWYGYPPPPPPQHPPPPQYSQQAPSPQYPQYPPPPQQVPPPTQQAVQQGSEMQGSSENLPPPPPPPPGGKMNQRKERSQ